MQLVIGNKTYSSWSLRAWLAVKVTGAPFEEKLILLDTPTFAKEVRAISPAGKVPTLIDSGVTVWDLLAITEYLAEKFPEAGLWPKDAVARAHARAIVAEMHSGFGALRSGYPMNLRRKAGARKNTPDAGGDLARVRQIWREARERFGGQGDYLFGAFSAADCFYAPVASRFTTYALPLDPVGASYAAAVMEHSFMREWRTEAAKEPWVVDADEAD